MGLYVLSLYSIIMKYTNLPLKSGTKIESKDHRGIVIGDIHGCIFTLENLLRELGSKDGFNPPQGRKLFSVGDLNDKGLNSLKVLRWAQKLHQDEKLYVVDSNHGRRLARRIHNECKMGGAVEDSIRELKKVTNEEMLEIGQFLANLPAYITLQSSKDKPYIIAHAAASSRLMAPGYKLSLRERNFFLSAETFRWSGEETVITGHVTVKEPLKEMHDNKGSTVIRLDTGVNEGNSLSAYLIEEDRFVSVPTDPRDLSQK